MRKWLKRIRGAVAMGLIWAVVWAPVGILIGLVVDPDGSMDEMWVAIGAYPGFFAGVAFAAVLGIAGRDRRFHELSLSSFAAWGALAGLLIGALPLALGAPTAGAMIGAIVIGTVALLGAASAAGSLALARMAESRSLLESRAAGGDPAGKIP